MPSRTAFCLTFRYALARETAVFMLFVICCVTVEKCGPDSMGRGVALSTDGPARRPAAGLKTLMRPRGLLDKVRKHGPIARWARRSTDAEEVAWDEMPGVQA